MRMIEMDTKIVTAVGVSGWAAKDTTYFVPLVEEAAAHFGIREVPQTKPTSPQ